MRQCIVLRLVLVVLAVLSSTAADAAPDNRNAATWYRRAFERAERISNADWDVLQSYWEDPDGPPPAGFRDVMSRVKPAIDLARRGSQQGYADYDLDYSQGFDLILPHLAPIRSVGKLIRFDVLLQLHDGNTAGAANSIATIYRMSSHFQQDGTLISSLVGNAMYGLAEGTADIGFDRTAFGPGESEIMLRAIQLLPESDPFGMAEAVAGEQAVTVDWLSSQFGDAEQRDGLVDHAWLEPDEVDAAAISDMSNEEFDAELEQYDRMMDDVVMAFAMEDQDAARAMLDEIAAEVEAGGHGVIAKIITPAFGKVYQRMVDSEKLIADRKKMLEALVTGEIKPEEKANAAYDYARGIAIIRELETDALDAVCAYEERPTDTPEPIVTTTLDSVQGFVDIFRDASMKQRCDFTVLRHPWDLAFCPDYVAGMRDAARFLHADAIRRASAGDAAEAADRLAICYRVTAHLAGDEPLVSALAAHRIFARNHQLIERALETDRLAGEHAETLHKAATRIGRRDPFGYIESVMELRKKIGWSLYNRLRPEEGDPELRNAIQVTLEDWNADQLMYYLAIEDTLRRAAEAKKSGAGGDAADAPDDADADAETIVVVAIDPVSRMDDIFAADALGAARDDVRIVAPLIVQGDIDFFRNGPPPMIADVVERMSKARGDLRRGVNLVRPDAPEAVEPAGP